MNDVLIHYGIPGQKKGVRRFQYADRRWTPEGKIRYGHKGEGRKKSGGIVSAFVKVSKNRKAIDYYNKNDNHSEVKLTHEVEPKVGRSPEEIDMELVKSINGDLFDSSDGKVNCVNCSAAYISSSVLGKPVKAAPVTNGLGRMTIDVYDIFDGIKSKWLNGTEGYSVTGLMKQLPPGTTGMLQIRSTVQYFYHMVNYEIAPDGTPSFIDCQNGKVFSGFNEIKKIEHVWEPCTVFDCSNVKFKSDISQEDFDSFFRK